VPFRSFWPAVNLIDLVVTPGTPPERLNILREAFAKSMKDPELLARGQKKQNDVDPSTAEELEALIKEAMSQPKKETSG
jgi:tripartite-type tricarboxylate transporter receptor subunit TctC